MMRDSSLKNYFKAVAIVNLKHRTFRSLVPLLVMRSSLVEYDHNSKYNKCHIRYFHVRSDPVYRNYNNTQVREMKQVCQDE